MKYPSGAYTVRIKTKPYLKKYISWNYGDPILIDKNNMLGQLIIALLQKNICHHLNLQQKHIAFQAFTAVVVCRIPYKYMSGYGVDLKDDHHIQLNKNFDNDFLREMHFFILRHATDGRYKGYDQLLEKFISQYGIVLDEDITFDALKKMYYRYRKYQEKIQVAMAIKTGLSLPQLFPANSSE